LPHFDLDPTKPTLFAPLVEDEQERKTVDLLIKSKRAFAGALADFPLLVFSTHPFFISIFAWGPSSEMDPHGAS